MTMETAIFLGAVAIAAAFWAGACAIANAIEAFGEGTAEAIKDHGVYTHAGHVEAAERPWRPPGWRLEDDEG